MKSTITLVTRIAFNEKCRNEVNDINAAIDLWENGDTTKSAVIEIRRNDIVWNLDVLDGMYRPL